MDEEKATIILAKELGDKLGRMVVVEEGYKVNLIDNALAVYQINNPLALRYQYGEYSDGNNNRKNIREIILLQRDSFAEANYYFLKSIHSSGGSGYPQSNMIVTPYALIGKKEENALKKFFYKNVRLDITRAMDILKIKNFIDIFSIYSNVRGINFFDCLACLNFINFVSQIKYDGDDEVRKTKFDEPFGGINKLNSLFEKIGIKERLAKREYLNENNLLRIVNQLKEKLSITKGYIFDEDFLNDFSEFVFSLPSEDQNINVNKEILRQSKNLDLVVDILINEYNGANKPAYPGVPLVNGYFQEYFEALNRYVQERVVDSLKLVPRNPTYDSFLWSGGFKDFELDYLSLYKEDAGKFIEYFNNRSPEERKVILGDVLKCEYMNQEVVEWLNAHESELLKEASFNG